MGNIINNIFKRIFDYPIKRKPICFYRPECFSSSGEPIVTSSCENELPGDNENVRYSFYENMKARRTTDKLMQEQTRMVSMKAVLKNFPGWNELTISNLHNLFLLFGDSNNGMLSLDDFCALIEKFGDKSSQEVRSTKFKKADSDGDGWITYDEFLPAVYNFNPPKGNTLRGLGKLCFEESEYIRFISNLSLGEQLQYGLF